MFGVPHRAEAGNGLKERRVRRRCSDKAHGAMRESGAGHRRRAVLRDEGRPTPHVVSRRDHTASGGRTGCSRKPRGASATNMESDHER